MAVPMVFRTTTGGSLLYSSNGPWRDVYRALHVPGPARYLPRRAEAALLRPATIVPTLQSRADEDKAADSADHTRSGSPQVVPRPL